MFSSTHNTAGNLPSSTPKWIIFLSCLVALWLNTLALPSEIHPFLPDFLLFILVFWSVFEPTKIGILSAWIIGLFMDSVHGTLLGQHSLCYALSVFLTILAKRRLFRFAAFYQSLHILPIIFIGKISIESISALKNGSALLPTSFAMGHLWIIPLWIAAYHWLFYKRRHTFHHMN